jgi:hypothetical protein
MISRNSDTVQKITGSCNYFLTHRACSIQWQTASVSNPASVSFPNINEWPQAAIQPILNCMAQWKVFGFQGIVRTLTGHFLNLFIDNGDTVRDLKETICHQNGVPPDQQWLIYLGQQLNNDDTPIATTGIENESVVYWVLQMRAHANTPRRQSPRRICQSPYFLCGVLKIRQDEVVVDLKKGFIGAGSSRNGLVILKLRNFVSRFERMEHCNLSMSLTKKCWVTQL